MFGARAGKQAAAFATAQPEPGGGLLAQALDEERRLGEVLLGQSAGTEKISTLRDEMQAAMESGAGIYRDAKGLETATGTIAEIRDRFKNVALDDRSLTFNTERVAWLELSNMLDLAEAIIASGLRRRESRGAHQRTDFPDRDDNDYLAHSLAHHHEDGPWIEYVPVTITRWPPGERVYGR